MADQEIAAVFQNLALQLSNLSTTVGAQGIAQIVSPFDGNPKLFKEWIKSIQKYALLTGINADKIKLVAYQSSKGAVSDFIQRYIADHPAHTWDQLKAELTTRFAEITDPQHAFMLLRKISLTPHLSSMLQLHSMHLRSPGL